MKKIEDFVKTLSFEYPTTSKKHWIEPYKDKYEVEIFVDVKCNGMNFKDFNQGLASLIGDITTKTKTKAKRQTLLLNLTKLLHQTVVDSEYIGNKLNDPPKEDELDGKYNLHLQNSEMLNHKYTVIISRDQYYKAIENQLGNAIENLRTLIGNSVNSQTLNWIGKQTDLFNLIEDKCKDGLIYKPINSKGKINYPSLAKQIVGSFKIQDEPISVEYATKTLRENVSFGD